MMRNHLWHHCSSTYPCWTIPSRWQARGSAASGTARFGTRIRQIELALAMTPSDFNNDSSSLLRELSDLQRQLRQPVILTEAG